MPTVGEILRAEREKQGLTVKDIEKSTSIRALYIQAIEDGKYDVLPGEVYLKGFMRNYASFLGLDAKNLLEVY
ncbi:MAG TPA: helix-turn-helix domain-containing protein, partial [Negativicutes bacterium]|nr:helix-turn-helix domain-containing protein [Negativicutes bacterium]